MRDSNSASFTLFIRNKTFQNLTTYMVGVAVVLTTAFRLMTKAVILPAVCALKAIVKREQL